MKLTRVWPLLCLGVLYYVCACRPKDTIMCTQEARAGLNIVVKDSRDNLFLRDSVKVIAASGSYTEALDNFPGNPPTFIGAWEREGTYTITVTHPRYQTCVLSPIDVLKDACHVIAQSQTVALLPK